jgi:hypothetical protein
VSSGLEASARVAPSADFLRYVETLGGAIGLPLTPTRTAPRQVSVARGAGAVIEARLLDIVLDRLPLEADLVVVTNVLPYFDDRELALALANISAMLAPGGVLLHNEARPEVGVITAELGLPLVQSRTAVLAAVRGGAPLYDTVFIHRQ